MTEFDMTYKFADGRELYNFSPGPCVLPKAVFDKSNEEMWNYRGSGQNVMELSHRQDEFRYLNL
jgi:phosphoserine aminotransferase